MWTNFLIFLCLLGVLTGSIFLSWEREYLFLFWLPLGCVLALLFLLRKQTKAFWSAWILIVLTVIAKAVSHQFWVTGFLYCAAFSVMAFLVRDLRYRFDEELSLSETVLEKSLSSLSLVEKREQAEDKKINEFQGKVNHLLRLYEVARDFNTCMNFQDLLQALKETVLTMIPCRCLKLLILSSEDPGKVQGFHIDRESIETWLGEGKISEVSRNRLAGLVEVQKVTCLEELNDFHLSEDRAGALQPPLWIYPLKIEAPHLAYLFLEGASERDFYPFQIVAGQLALQIQKTLLYERVHELSLYDGLTHVYVRRHIEDRLGEELRRSHTYHHPLSVLMLDVDHFKAANDQYGHLAGDRILKEIATMIQENVRTVDLVGRYGGEEFILIFPEADVKGSEEAAERIRSAVAKRKIRVYDEEVRITISIGIAVFPQDVENADKVFNPLWKEQLIERADQALYQAKEDGRNQVKTYPKGKE